jgi:tRNA-splicing ligase RtcB (3'-phosphate/5'-hydroxy nucleic acid ligase)
MKNKDLYKIGIPGGAPAKQAIAAASKLFAQGIGKHEVMKKLEAVAATPQAFVGQGVYAELAKALLDCGSTIAPILPREIPVPYVRYGTNLEESSVKQMENACRLPVAVRGALMPDAHLGYGLPIGGVLATDNAVIPFAVGVDIACRMKLTVLDVPLGALSSEKDRLIRILERETAFGVGAHFKQKRQHAVMDEDWSFSIVTNRLKDKAWKQLGTSGSGNHFVEFGTLTVLESGLGLAPGEYVSVLSHSGSRGSGQEVAKHYSEVARAKCEGLPRELSHLSWLMLDSPEGKEYWQSMELMGRYASANHELIHRSIARAVKAEVLLDIENHHNFAWKEQHNNRNVIVHRKGATPAGKGVLGIIPGSMATPGFIVRGSGEAASLCSASHGAGRQLSRSKAKESFTWSETKKVLDARGVTLISAGLDEVPMAYKDINEVMSAQQDLVDILARFEPRIVKMAPSGEPPED